MTHQNVQEILNFNSVVFIWLFIVCCLYLLYEKMKLIKIRPRAKYYPKRNGSCYYFRYSHAVCQNISMKVGSQSENMSLFHMVFCRFWYFEYFWSYKAPKFLARRSYISERIVYGKKPVCIPILGRIYPPTFFSKWIIKAHLFFVCEVPWENALWFFSEFFGHF